MAHNRKLVLFASDLVKWRAPVEKKIIPVMGEIMDEIGVIMVQSGFLTGAPFRWINMSLLFGLKNDEEPYCGEIDPKDGELLIEMELDTHPFLKSRDANALKRAFMIATLKGLIHVGKKHGLPTAALVERMERALSGMDKLRAG